MNRDLPPTQGRVSPQLRPRLQPDDFFRGQKAKPGSSHNPNERRTPAPHLPSVQKEEFIIYIQSSSKQGSRRPQRAESSLAMYGLPQDLHHKIPEDSLPNLTCSQGLAQEN